MSHCFIYIYIYNIYIFNLYSIYIQFSIAFYKEKCGKFDMWQGIYYLNKTLFCWLSFSLID